jgi:hypothetical protein
MTVNESFAEKRLEVVFNDVDFSQPVVEIMLPGDVKLTAARAIVDGQVVNDELWGDSQRSRGNYQIYNPRGVPRADNLDYKPGTVVYFTKASWVSSGGMKVNEGACIRMVATGGNYGGSEVEDLSFFVFHPNDGPTFMSIPDLLHAHSIDLNSVALTSRIGKIPPPGQGRNNHLAVCFTVMNAMAIADARKMGIDYFICLLRPDLQNKFLAHEGATLDFVPAIEQLRLSDEGIIGLDRRDTILPYFLSYPGYFFNAEEIADAWNTLSANGHANELTALQELLGLPSTDEFAWYNLSSLGAWFELVSVVDGKLRLGEEGIGSARQKHMGVIGAAVEQPKIPTGEELELGKKLINQIKQNASDGVYLSLSHLDDWERSCYNLLETASARPI